MPDEPLPEKPESPAGSAPKGSAGGGESETLAWHRLAGIGVEFVAAVGVFAGLGWYADTKFGTSPWLLITGCGLGFVGGLWNMITAARKYMG
ncbi:MAG TPA: AtpZ/AtpI family protein [Humisphaera sp.]